MFFPGRLFHLFAEDPMGQGPPGGPGNADRYGNANGSSTFPELAIPRKKTNIPAGRAVTKPNWVSVMPPRAKYFGRTSILARKGTFDFPARRRPLYRKDIARRADGVGVGIIVPPAPRSGVYDGHGVADHVDDQRGDGIQRLRGENCRPWINARQGHRKNDG